MTSNVKGHVHYNETHLNESMTTYTLDRSASAVGANEKISINAISKLMKRPTINPLMDSKHQTEP